VRNNGEHVQGSPFKFYASPNDEGKVYAYGPGLSHGVCGDSSNFVISTKGDIAKPILTQKLYFEATIDCLFTFWCEPSNVQKLDLSNFLSMYLCTYALENMKKFAKRIL
jgi:hypothetical protein